MYFFHFHSISNRYFCKQTVKTRSAASDLGLHCLPMSQKLDARLIWVKVAKDTKILHVVSEDQIAYNNVPCTHIFCWFYLPQLKFSTKRYKKL